MWFSSNVIYARAYTTKKVGKGESLLPRASIYGGNKDRLIPVYISVQNPADIGSTDGRFEDTYLGAAQRLRVDPEDLREVWTKSGEPERMWEVVRTQEMADLLSDYGYDGIKSVENGTKCWAVFSPNQVKSAVSNVETFDSSNNDIRYSIDDPAETDE